MTSVIISADSEKVGDAIGQQVAARLGYHHIGRELLKELAESYGTTEEKLARVLEGKTSRWTKKSEERLLAGIQAATSERLVADSIVCTGLGAHLYIRGVAHILIVRVLSLSAPRLAAETGVSLKKAFKKLDAEEARRARWSRESFGLDESRASNYDMVVRLTQIEPQQAVQLICDMAQYPRFRPMSYSMKTIKDLALASRVRADLLSEHPEIRVSANGDTVIVHVRCSPRQKPRTVEAIKSSAGKLPGVKVVEVHAMKKLPNQPIGEVLS